MKWNSRDKAQHNTCIHLIGNQKDGTLKECGITIAEGLPHRWLCPMHDRIVFGPEMERRRGLALERIA